MTWWDDRGHLVRNNSIDKAEKELLRTCICGTRTIKRDLTGEQGTGRAEWAGGGKSQKLTRQTRRKSVLRYKTSYLQK